MTTTTMTIVAAVDWMNMIDYVEIVMTMNVVDVDS
jgi:hypothetical protein